MNAMPFADITNASLGAAAAADAGIAKQGSVTTTAPPAVATVAFAADHGELPAHLRDPTFGLGEALIATPALAMRTDRRSGEGCVCIVTCINDACARAHRLDFPFRNSKNEKQAFAPNLPHRTEWPATTSALRA